MNNKILNFINQLEGWKCAIKNIHWNSSSLEQHQVCDDVAGEISDFQDMVSEVEQSISGKLAFNKLKGIDYHVTTIQKFMKDVISGAKSFYKELDEMGDDYIGLRSECESFLAKMQRLSYLVDFTIKESFKRAYKKKINEDFETENGILSDALDAIDASGGQISFEEWAGAFPDEEEAYLHDVWDKACDNAGYESLKENKDNMAKNKIALTESQLSNVISEAINNVISKFMNEGCQTEAEVKGGMYNDKELDYTHFAVNKYTNLIVDGWCYAGYDNEELASDKKNYFIDDLKDNGFNPRMYQILTFKACQKRGIDPNNKDLWSNTGVYSLPREEEMQRQGKNPYELAEKEHPDWFVEN